MRSFSRIIIVIIVFITMLPLSAQADSEKKPLSRDKIEEYATLIANEQMSIEDAKILRSSLSKDDINNISKSLENKLIEKKSKIKDNQQAPILTPEEEINYLNSKQVASQLEHSILDTRPGCDPGEPVYCWRQNIDNTAITGNVYQAPQHASAHYFTISSCDSDPDTDLVLTYQYNHYSNPDSLLFYTTSASITWVLDGSLNGYGANPNYDVRLCIPNTVRSLFSDTFIRDNIIIARMVIA